jgi:hypothetical protein
MAEYRVIFLVEPKLGNRPLVHREGRDYRIPPVTAIEADPHDPEILRVTAGEDTFIGSWTHPPSSQGPPSSPLPPRKGLGCCGWTVVVILGLVVVGWLFSLGGSNPTRSEIASVGDVARLETDTGTMVFVAATKEALDRLNRLAAANDTVGVAQLAEAGLVYPVRHGTQARVLGAGWATMEVRIIDGPYAGRSGWVASEFVRKP